MLVTNKPSTELQLYNTFRETQLNEKERYNLTVTLDPHEDSSQAFARLKQTFQCNIAQEGPSRGTTRIELA